MTEIEGRMAQPANSVPLHINTQLDLCLGPRFSDLRPRGCGANGFVYSAVDTDCDKKVAIKKISFSDSITCKYALREIKIMRRMQHENIVSTHEILGVDGKALEHEGAANLNDLLSAYIIQELLDTDLHYVIQSQQVTEEHCRFFMYQLFRGLKYMHSANVVHRDLKPSNVLISCDDLMLKIGDFGLARVIDPHYDHSGMLTENMGTAWYRSPEQILHPKDYNKAIDVWSAGCIFAEMLTGRPLCRGVNDLDQLLQILDTIQLEDSDWDEVLTLISNKVFKNHPLKVVVPLRERLVFCNREAVDLLEALLTFNPKRRITVEEALSHAYFKQYFDVRDEPVALSPLYIEHEDDCQPVGTLKKMIMEEVNSNETCGSATDWQGWEALHSIQESCRSPVLQELQLDSNGNIPEIIPTSTPSDNFTGLPSVTCDHSELHPSDNANFDDMSNFFVCDKSEIDCNDKNTMKSLRNQATSLSVEVNEKYQVEEKESEGSPSKWEEDNINQSRKNVTEADIMADKQFQFEETENYRNTKHSEEVSTSRGDNEHYSLPISKFDEDYIGIAIDSDEDYDSKVDDFNKKNNTLNAANNLNSSYTENTHSLEFEADSDIFSIEKNRKESHASKHDIIQELAFKEEFNLRQKINTGLQNQGSIYENQCFTEPEKRKRRSKKAHRPKICDLGIDDYVQPSFPSLTNSRHVANERLRKSIMSQKAPRYMQENLFCEDGFLINEQACSGHDPASPVLSTMDWILFGTDSRFRFPNTIPTSQSITSIQDNAANMNSKSDNVPCEQLSPRDHPSGAKPKKYNRKTKAV